MIRKIILENYMSHTRTVIEPAAGLTVLVGPNNCGKSAVVSALETLARNARGDFMIRHDAKESRITVETDDGHVVVWRRKSSGAAGYEIDGKSIDRLNRGAPAELHQILKLPEVEPAVGGDAFDVHFGMQKSPIFLLDEPESRAATFFSASSDAGRLLEIQDRHRDKVRQQKSRKRDAEAQIARFDADLVRLEAIDPVAPLVELAESEHAKILAEMAEIQGLEQHAARLEAAQRHAASCRELVQASEPLRQPPALEDDAALERLLQMLAAQSRGREKSKADGELLAHLMPAPGLPDLRPLQEAIASLHQAAIAALWQRGISDALGPLRDIPTLAEFGPLAETIRRVEGASRELGGRIAALESLTALQEPPPLPDAAPLGLFVTSLDVATRHAAICFQAAAQCERELRDVEADIAAWAEENPNCPVCGGSINPRQLFEPGGHRHV